MFSHHFLVSLLILQSGIYGRKEPQTAAKDVELLTTKKPISGVYSDKAFITAAPNALESVLNHIIPTEVIDMHPTDCNHDDEIATKVMVEDEDEHAVKAEVTEIMAGPSVTEDEEEDVVVPEESIAAETTEDEDEDAVEPEEVIEDEDEDQDFYLAEATEDAIAEEEFYPAETTDDAVEPQEIIEDEDADEDEDQNFYLAEATEDAIAEEEFYPAETTDDAVEPQEIIEDEDEEADEDEDEDFNFAESNDKGELLDHEASDSLHQFTSLAADDEEAFVTFSTTTYAVTSAVVATADESGLFKRKAEGKKGAKPTATKKIRTLKSLADDESTEAFKTKAEREVKMFHTRAAWALATKAAAKFARPTATAKGKKAGIFKRKDEIKKGKKGVKPTATKKVRTLKTLADDESAEAFKTKAEREVKTFHTRAAWALATKAAAKFARPTATAKGKKAGIFKRKDEIKKGKKGVKPTATKKIRTLKTLVDDDSAEMVKTREGKRLRPLQTKAAWALKTKAFTRGKPLTATHYKSRGKPFLKKAKATITPGP